MDISPEVMSKVSMKEAENIALNRCLDVRVCPKCGSDLKRHTYDGGGESYECLSSLCKFEYER